MTSHHRKIIWMCIGLLLLFTPAIVALYLFANNISCYSLYYRNGDSFTDLATLNVWSYLTVLPPFTLGAIILSRLPHSCRSVDPHD